jgi:hypothetical protein
MQTPMPLQLMQLQITLQPLAGADGGPHLHLVSMPTYYVT